MTAALPEMEIDQIPEGPYPIWLVGLLSTVWGCVGGVIGAGSAWVFSNIIWELR